MSSRSLALPVDDGGLSYDGLRYGLGVIAHERGDWAGIPVPLEAARLVIEPSFPKAKELAAIGGRQSEDDAVDHDDGWRLRNRWYSLRHRCDILIMERDDKIDWGKLPAFHHIAHDLTTLGCSEAWGIEQEANAIDLLQQMLRERQFRQYLLTGMFLERSQRSGVTYLFRRLKPTIAIGVGEAKGRGMRILAALCMHPIAYYAGSWAGAMCPTDDVIAHLALMRGDEHMLWKRCNQHPPYRPEAGL